MKQKEYDIVLQSSVIRKTEEEIANLDNLMEGNVDWIKVAGILLNHRLGGYFFVGLNPQQKKRVPKEIIKALDLLVLGQSVRQNEIINELKIVSAALNNTSIRYAGLKGIIFGTEMYPLGARRSNDIDLLVFEKDLDLLDPVMRNLGYIQTNDPDTMIEASKREKIIQRMNYHDLVPYVKKIDGKVIEIDINFLFDGKENIIDDKVFEMGTREYSGQYYSFRGLNPVTFLAFLFVHFYREATEKIWVESKRNITLYKIVDIYNYIRFYKADLDIHQVVDTLKKLNILEKAYCTLGVLQELYDDDYIELLKTEIGKQCSEEINNKAINLQKDFFSDLLTD